MSADDNIVLAYIHSEDLRMEFVQSLINTIAWDYNNTRHLIAPGGWVDKYSGPNLSTSRNDVVDYFLSQTQADWLLCVDSDMAFAPNAHHKIWSSAHEVGATVMSGLCWIMRSHPTLGAAMAPSAKMWPDGPGYGDYDVVDFPSHPVQVDGVGAAFLLIHRRALLDVLEGEFSTCSPWFQETHYGDEPCSEDLEFCIRLAKVGHKVWVDPRIEIAHMKEIPLMTRTITTPLLRTHT